MRQKEEKVLLGLTFQILRSWQARQCAAVQEKQEMTKEEEKAKRDEII